MTESKGPFNDSSQRYNLFLDQRVEKQVEELLRKHGSHSVVIFPSQLRAIGENWKATNNRATEAIISDIEGVTDMFSIFFPDVELERSAIDEIIAKTPLSFSLFCIKKDALEPRFTKDEFIEILSRDSSLSDAIEFLRRQEL